MSNMKSEYKDKPKDNEEEAKYDDSPLKNIDMELRANDVREQQRKYYEERMKETAEPKSGHSKNHTFSSKFKAKVGNTSKRDKTPGSILLNTETKKEGEIDADSG